MYKLRPYQQKAVDKTLAYFRNTSRPGVVVLPTGAGKSLVIAELARIARGRVLVLAHVKELVEQNHQKYESYGISAGIFSAGLGRKDINEKVIFGSIQSIANADDTFFKEFTLLVIDECHRVPMVDSSQYQQVIDKLRSDNKNIKILGLTATPFRLPEGWIYNYHYNGIVRTSRECFFKECIYELPLSYMIRNKYLTPPIKVDSPVACYDFSSLFDNSNGGLFSFSEVERLLLDQSRVTPGIIANIVEQAEDRKGVMIFTSTVRHAREILTILPSGESAIVTGDTESSERDCIISDFKSQKIKFLVNVSVLTTGFDAPHVDLIAVLRPTESIGLYLQIVGRGLRLFEGKKDCLILDYTGLDYNIFGPEVSDKKFSSDSEPVQVICPDCGHGNIFWGKTDSDGSVIEHYGRKCQGGFKNETSDEVEVCSYRFRFKECESCGAENDIAAKICNHCDAVLVDPDKKLKEAMQLKDAHVMRSDHMELIKVLDNKKNKYKLEIRFYDLDGEHLSEFYYLDTKSQQKAFYHNYVRYHLKTPGSMNQNNDFNIDIVLNLKALFRVPQFIIARKFKSYWKIREKIFTDNKKSRFHNSKTFDSI